MSFLTTVRDLLRYNVQFAIGATLTLVIVILATLSFFSPYNPLDTYMVAMDASPSAAVTAQTGRCCGSRAAPRGRSKGRNSGVRDSKETDTRCRVWLWRSRRTGPRPCLAPGDWNS